MNTKLRIHIPKSKNAFKPSPTKVKYAGNNLNYQMSSTLKSNSPSPRNSRNLSGSISKPESRMS